MTVSTQILGHVVMGHVGRGKGLTLTSSCHVVQCGPYVANFISFFVFLSYFYIGQANFMTTTDD